MLDNRIWKAYKIVLGGVSPPKMCGKNIRAEKKI